MIKIITNKYDNCTEYIVNKLNNLIIEHEVFVANNELAVMDFLKRNVSPNNVIVMIGNSADMNKCIANAFQLTMFYDKQLSQRIAKYCEKTNTPVPPQYVMDKLCMLPESFIHCKSLEGLVSGCEGDYKQCRLIVIPSIFKACISMYDATLLPVIKLITKDCEYRYFKIFGLTENEVIEHVQPVCNSKIVQYSVTNNNLDNLLTLRFKPNVSKSVIADVTKLIINTFSEYLYSDKDETLQQIIVRELTKVHKTLAVAESLTGGMLTSKIIDVSGASAVLYEGAVTYSVASKCNRLNINPHFVDKYGVVSSQVAHEMVEGLLSTGKCDFAISTTGYAGPTSENGQPVGLCYIAVGTKSGISVYKNIFSGDRQQIRQQASDSAMYYLIKKLM